ncbi:hypothetical protein L9F63_020811, partial [Diploptera punctata]
NQKETPIEREIRLAREREEELRREKRLPPLNSQFTSLSESKRLKSSTSEVQFFQKILEACNTVWQPVAFNKRLMRQQKERELREAGTIHTTSEETVDSKVTRFTDLAEFAIEEQDRKLHKSVSTSHIPQSVNEDTPVFSSSTPLPKVENNSIQCLGDLTLKVQLYLGLVLHANFLQIWVRKD